MQDYGRPAVKPDEPPVVEESAREPEGVLGGEAFSEVRLRQLMDQTGDYDFDVPEPAAVAAGVLEPVEAIDLAAAEPGAPDRGRRRRCNDGVDRPRSAATSSASVCRSIRSSLDQPDTPFVLLDRRADHTYVAQSGLAGPDGIDSRAGTAAVPHRRRSSYRIEAASPSKSSCTTKEDGIFVEKRFRFDPASYYVELEYEIDNRRAAADDGEPLRSTQAGCEVARRQARDSRLGPRPYLGAALTTVDSRYEKVDFEDLDDEELREEVKGRLDRDAAALLPECLGREPGQSQRTYYGYPNRARGRDLHRRLHRPRRSPSRRAAWRSVGAGFYAGPEGPEPSLEEIAPNLNLTVDYGFLWWLAVPLFRLLEIIQSFAHNWGVAIILMTFVIKLILYPLSACQLQLDGEGCGSWRRR